MNIVDKTYEDQRVILHGNSYRNCTFKNCELVYDGDRSPTFHNNEFVDSVFVFSDAALRTLYFIGNIYHAGEGGQEVIENLLAEIKGGAIHGHEARTIIPPTASHSLGQAGPGVSH
ncbi:hypothetical protein R50073_17570 [Maricurvus nonylphenolicus]|uniref:hypothetical protein n=1 Tax=Maricurvus nonylphenolicus TaxID=1008307 RepID=UPI0036F1A584